MMHLKLPSSAALDKSVVSGELLEARIRISISAEDKVVGEAQRSGGDIRYFEGHNLVKASGSIAFSLSWETQPFGGSLLFDIIRSRSHTALSIPPAPRCVYPPTRPSELLLITHGIIAL